MTNGETAVRSGDDVKRREPSPEEFRRLLYRLDPDTVQAWVKYNRLRLKLVKFFEWHHCRDAEDLAPEVLERIASKPDLDLICSVPEFAVGVARNLCKESHRRQHRELALEDCPAGAESLADPRSCGDPVDHTEQDPILECLEICLARLDKRDKVLAVQYYHADGVKLYVKRRMLAISFGSTANALRVHLNRLRGKLEREVVELLKNRPPTQ
ncbi:MAG: hypothetical protein LAQ69_23850 [Acidobacteriia bacterium]|nr:hypothetical protein [Terriglobia bacterium]